MILPFFLLYTQTHQSFHHLSFLSLSFFLSPCWLIEEKGASMTEWKLNEACWFFLSSSSSTLKLNHFIIYFFFPSPRWLMYEKGESMTEWEPNDAGWFFLSSSFTFTFTLINHFCHLYSFLFLLFTCCLTEEEGVTMTEWKLTMLAYIFPFFYSQTHWSFRHLFCLLSHPFFSFAGGQKRKGSSLSSSFFTFELINRFFISLCYSVLLPFHSLTFLYTIWIKWK